MPRTAAWEFLGQVLSAGAALFGVIYGSSQLSALRITFVGVFASPPSPEAAVGLAGLALTVLGSFVAILVGRLRKTEGGIGSTLLFWVDFVVLLLGDALFYALGPSAATAVVMLVGLASAVLTSIALTVTGQGPPVPAP